MPCTSITAAIAIAATLSGNKVYNALQNTPCTKCIIASLNDVSLLQWLVMIRSISDEKVNAHVVMIKKQL